MNRRDFDALAKATKAELKGVGEAFQSSADPHATLAGFIASVVSGADGCTGFDRAKFLKQCGVPNEQ